MRSATCCPLLPLLLLLVVVCSARAYLPLPKYVQPCRIAVSDRKLSECAFKSAQILLPQVMKGDPTYNIPVLEPLHVDRMVVIDGKGPLGMQLLTTDIYLHGLSNLSVTNVTYQRQLALNTYVITVPEILINAKYNISGRILLLPIVGNGNVVMHLRNVTVAYQYENKVDKLEDGETYYIPLPGARLNVNTDVMTVELDNIFNGDKTLLKTTNRFLNEEWREVFLSLKPAFEEEIAKIITNILNGIFTQVRYKDAFLDVEDN